MEEALLAVLLADAGLAAVVAGRISWGWRQSGSAFPAITLTTTDGVEDVTIDGVRGFVDGYVQADIWSVLAKDGVLAFRAFTTACAGVNAASTGGVIQLVRRMHHSSEFEGEAPDRLFRTRASLHVPHLQV